MALGWEHVVWHRTSLLRIKFPICGPSLVTLSGSANVAISAERNLPEQRPDLFEKAGPSQHFRPNLVLVWSANSALCGPAEFIAFLGQSRRASSSGTTIQARQPTQPATC